jgi:hypothetical protein
VVAARAMGVRVSPKAPVCNSGQRPVFLAVNGVNSYNL